MSFSKEGLSIDYAQRKVALDGEPVELTATEYAVLYELAVHAPRVLNQSLLLQRVWGPERVGEGWLVRDVVKRLRRKLGMTPPIPGTSSPNHGWGIGWPWGRGSYRDRRGSERREELSVVGQSAEVDEICYLPDGWRYQRRPVRLFGGLAASHALRPEPLWSGFIASLAELGRRSLLRVLITGESGAGELSVCQLLLEHEGFLVVDTIP